MSSSSSVRVRFAPSPTGMMHLGNVRAALLNYVFAKKNKGIFILRIEDTDPERNFDPGAQHIIADLTWLGLLYDEGPIKDGPHAPYFQSERTNLYKQKLEELIKKQKVYRCFCTPEELEKKRQRQIALKQPPRYDRTCYNLSADQVKAKLDANIPYIWRLITMADHTVTISDLAHGVITFNLKDFSDLPLSRTDGSFTFIFANCVDDIDMQISHIIRGEDHLTNTAGQVVLYNAFDAKIPVFWHLPIICNITGKKLSKRDFGFSLNDLRDAGYLAEAIDNYLGIIGGSFKQEILSLDELAQAFDFANVHSTGHIRYDVEKLKWMNHQWINKITVSDLVERCIPFLVKEYPSAQKLSADVLTKLIAAIKTDLVTLQDCVPMLRFYFEMPHVTHGELKEVLDDKVKIFTDLIHTHISSINNVDTFLDSLKKDATSSGITTKQLFWSLRLLLTGAKEGLNIKELFEVLGTHEVSKRLEKLI